MKVQKSHLQIAVFLLAAAVLYAVASYIRPSAPTTPPTRGQEPLLGADRRQVPDRDTVDPSAIPAPPEVDTSTAPGWRRDPFLFGHETRDVVRQDPVRLASADPLVRSILFSTTRRVALVENKMVGVGDAVGAFRVAEIERSAVIFTLPSGERRRVALHRPPPGGLTR